MVVLTALRSALAGLARNPVLFVVAAALALFQLPQLAAQALGPAAASVVSALFSLASLVVVPFFQAGLLGMADEALDGRTRAGRFLAAGREHYVAMLVAYLLLLAVLFVFWIVALIGGLVFAVFAFGSGGSVFGDPALLAVAGMLVLVAVVVYLGTVFFVQFYGQAIVVEDLGAIDGYRRSVRLVRRNLVPTLGYSLLAWTAGLGFGAVAAVASLLLSTPPAAMPSLPQVSTGAAVVLGVAVVVLTALFSAFFMTFSVAFYRGIASREAGSDAAQAAD